MTNRELLEMAAKAVGILLEWDGPPGDWVPMYYSGKTYHGWNPLEDDGDALRLAVKLRMLVACEDCCAMGPNGKVQDDWFGGAEDPHVGVSHDECDPYAYTRRAIVRAAAEVGKAMP